LLPLAKRCWTVATSRIFFFLRWLQRFVNTAPPPHNTLHHTRRPYTVRFDAHRCRCSAAHRTRGLTIFLRTTFYTAHGLHSTRATCGTAYPQHSLLALSRCAAHCAAHRLSVRFLVRGGSSTTYLRAHVLAATYPHYLREQAYPRYFRATWWIPLCARCQRARSTPHTHRGLYTLRWLLPYQPVVL